MDDRLAVGYVRVSTEEQSREGVSLDAQEADSVPTANCRDCPWSPWYAMRG
jgi:hypothetical protein